MPSLSQKYRPKTFGEITGQHHVTDTLRKEVASGILGHAYLFSGPRGVGKTTTARVFAKALNCERPKDGEPCNACAPCTSANQGRFLDLIELDAATHTGVDMVREAIIEHARFAPVLGKRKIYVLDEAHMLSASSWNALLKTLEEPPAYAFFILATTEWHKVPATIVSRCQRFEFTRLNVEDLSDRVRELSKQEGWRIAEDVVRLIVSRADGCVRDAETLLGQLGSLGETDITADVAGLVIPSSHLPLAAGLMSRWADQDHTGALQETTRLFDEGIPFLPLFDDLISIVRQLLAISGDPSRTADWKNGTEEERALATLVGRFTPGELHDLALLLFERRRDVKGGMDPLFALQLVSTMVSCGLLKNSKPIQDKKPDDKNNPDAGVSPNIRPFESDHPGQTHGSVPTISISEVRMKWNAFIRAVDEQNHSLPFILKISRPEEVNQNTLVIRFQYPFHRDKIMSDKKNYSIVEACARTVFGCADLRLEGMIGADVSASSPHPRDVVSTILNAFGGNVVEP